MPVDSTGRKDSRPFLDEVVHQAPGQRSHDAGQQIALSRRRDALQRSDSQTDNFEARSPFERLPYELQAQCFQALHLTIGDNVRLQTVSKSFCHVLRSDLFWSLPYRGEFCPKANLSNAVPREFNHRGLFKRYAAAVRKIRGLRLGNDQAFVSLIRQQPMFCGPLLRPMGSLVSNRYLYDASGAMRRDWPSEHTFQIWDIATESTGPVWVTKMLVLDDLQIGEGSSDASHLLDDFVARTSSRMSRIFSARFGRELSQSELSKGVSQFLDDRAQAFVASWMPRGMIMAAFAEHGLSPRALPEDWATTFETKFMLYASCCGCYSLENSAQARLGSGRATMDGLPDPLGWLGEGSSQSNKFLSLFWQDLNLNGMMPPSDLDATVDFHLKIARFNPSALEFATRVLSDSDKRSKLSTEALNRSEQTLLDLVHLSPWAYQRIPNYLQKKEKFAFAALKTSSCNIAYVPGELFSQDIFAEQLFLWLGRRPGATSVLVKRIAERGYVESICRNGHDLNIEQRWALSMLKNLSRADSGRDSLFVLWLSAWPQFVLYSKMRQGVAEFIAILSAQEKFLALQYAFRGQSLDAMDGNYRSLLLAVAQIENRVTTG